MCDETDIPPTGDDDTGEGTESPPADSPQERDTASDTSDSSEEGYEADPNETQDSPIENEAASRPTEIPDEVADEEIRETLRWASDAPEKVTGITRDGQYLGGMGFVQVEPDADQYYDAELGAILSPKTVEVINQLTDDLDTGQEIFERLSFIKRVDPDWSYNNFDPHRQKLEKAAIMADVTPFGDESSNPFEVHESMLKYVGPGLFKISNDPEIEAIIKYQASAHKQANDPDSSVEDDAVDSRKAWLYGVFSEYVERVNDRLDPEVRISIRKWGKPEDNSADWVDDFPYADYLAFGRLGGYSEFAVLVDIEYRHVEPINIEHLEDALEEELIGALATSLYENYSEGGEVSAVDRARKHLTSDETESYDPDSSTMPEGPWLEYDATVHEDEQLVRIVAAYHR
ncbi:hypothetical protein [Halobaculum sp. EA56]|uniref:hypothetical protein n=1 Tax=Halobaculum sp. EA56 TaxID=3421648 RepID=UPI003EBB0451